MDSTESFEKKQNIILFLSIALVGFASTSIQIVLLRELISAFYGNELIYGIIISIWLLLVAIGSAILGKFICFIKNSRIGFAASLFIISAIIPFEVYFSRTIKEFLNIPFGQTPSLQLILIGSFIVLAPITLMFGFLFAMASKMLSEKENSKGIGIVYLFEALGALSGGIFMTYILLTRLNPFAISFLLSILIFVITISILSFSIEKIYLKIIISIPLLFLIFVHFFCFFFLSRSIDIRSTQKTFKDFKVISLADSLYGRTTLTSFMGEFNIYHNGNLISSTADKALNEEIAHLSLIEHTNPKSILLIGGGSCGIIEEILKHRIDSLDYIELDSSIISLSLKYIKFPRPKVLNIITLDGRFFLNTVDKKYDMIIINLPNPESLLVNRFYTKEFFEICKSHLKPDGIFSLHLESSESYMNPELRLLNQSINKTLNQVFYYTIAITGNYNYFFCTQKPGMITKSRNILSKRFLERNLSTKHINPFIIWFMLSKWRIDYTAEMVRYDESTRINRDLMPISFLYSINFWLSKFEPGLKALFSFLSDVKLKNIYYTVFILAIALLILKHFLKFFERISILTAIATVGFVGMAINIIMILSFQTVYGYVYSKVGILIASFMAGISIGSFLATKFYEKIKNPALIIKLILFIFFLYVSCITLFFENLGTKISYNFLFSVSEILFPLAIFLIALPVGLIFPFAIKLYQRLNPKIEGLAGTIYGADLIGGALASFLTSVIFVPIFGIIKTLYLSASLLIFSIIVLL